MNRKRKKAIFAAVFLLVPAVIAWCFFANTLWIPAGMRASRVIQGDPFAGSHMQLGKGAVLYTAAEIRFESADPVKRRSVYRAELTDADGNSFSVSLFYPGTPKRQVFGYPRLRDSMDLVLLTQPDEVSRGSIRDEYLLFLLQTIDGETYVYPLYMDDTVTPYTLLGERAAFQYVEESRIYDPWHDADVLKLCKNPEFSYKVRYEEFKDNIWKLLR